MITTTNAKIVETLIRVAMLTLLVSRLIYNLVRMMADVKGKEVVRFTHLHWVGVPYSLKPQVNISLRCCII